MDELQGGGDVGRAELGNQEEAATCGEVNGSRDSADEMEGSNLMRGNPMGEGQSDSKEEAKANHPDVAEENEISDAGGKDIAEEAADDGSNSPVVDLTFDSSAITTLKEASEAFLVEIFGEAASNQDSEQVRSAGFRVAAGLLVPPLPSFLAGLVFFPTRSEE
jgi:hypothetical protein